MSARDDLDGNLRKLAELNDSAAVELKQIGEGLQRGEEDEDAGRSVLRAVASSLVRLVRAARQVRAACPRCNRPDAKMEFETVNKLSGVWKLPRCESCGELADLISAVEKQARASLISDDV